MIIWSIVKDYDKLLGDVHLDLQIKSYLSDFGALDSIDKFET